MYPDCQFSKTKGGGIRLRGGGGTVQSLGTHILSEIMIMMIIIKEE